MNFYNVIFSTYMYIQMNSKIDSHTGWNTQSVFLYWTNNSYAITEHDYFIVKVTFLLDWFLLSVKIICTRIKYF